MIAATRILAACAALGMVTGGTAGAQVACNTWQTMPPVPVEPNPVVGLVYDATTQSLYQATDDGFGGHQGTQPWVGRRNGNAWVTMLDPNAFSFGSVLGLELLDLGAGPTLYAFGSWSPLAGQTNLLRWNGTSFVNEPNVPVGPTALTVFDAGSGPELFACNFANVYRLSGGTWVSIGAATVSATTWALAPA